MSYDVTQCVLYIMYDRYNADSKKVIWPPTMMIDDDRGSNQQPNDQKSSTLPMPHTGTLVI